MIQEQLSQIVGSKLKAYIKDSKYVTQQNFADAFHVDVTTVRKWIHNGIHDIDTIEQIAKMFDMSIWDFFK